jgi:ribosomal protein S18 acetylase RimI-like enzyme
VGRSKILQNNTALNMSGYKMKLIDTDDLEIIRRIRNDCKDFMTNNSDYINRDQQIDWYKNLDKSSNLVYLFEIEHHGIQIPIGYGLIKKTSDEAWLSGGLINGYRDKGLGRILFSKLINISKRNGKRPVIEVLKENVRAIRLYEKLGFSYIGETEKIFLMEHK